MAVPRFDDFLYPFLVHLKNNEVTIKEMKEYLCKDLGLTEEDKTIMTRKGTVSQFDDRVGWARQYLRRAGMIFIPQRGVYSITQRGLDFLKNHSTLTVDDLSEFPEFSTFAHTKKVITPDKPAEPEEITPTEQLENAFQSIQDDLAAEILEKTLSQSPRFFERIVLDLLLKMGYGDPTDDSAQVTQYVHDDGIDGIIPQDKLGLDKIYFQAKRYKEGNVIAKPQIQGFVGALDEQKADKGVFITTSTFSKEARTFSEKTSKKIILIDGSQLARYMIEYNVGVNTRKIYEVKKIDTDYFEEQ